MPPQDTAQTGEQPSKNLLLAGLITKALAYNENGGKPNLEDPSAGQSGELKSIFQYTPDTWKGVSKQITGHDLPMNNDNETFVTVHRVNDWLQKGYTPQQIFSMHNAGQGEPNAYEGSFSNGQPSTGKNNHGVQYNVSKYVDSGMKYLRKFMTEHGMAPEGSKEAESAAAPEKSLAAAQAPTHSSTSNTAKKGLLQRGPPSRGAPQGGGGLVRLRGKAAQ